MCSGTQYGFILGLLVLYLRVSSIRAEYSSADKYWTTRCRKIGTVAVRGSTLNFLFVFPTECFVLKAGRGGVRGAQ